MSLLNNRAAANLALKNYGSVLRDVGIIIGLCIGVADSDPPRTNGEKPRQVAVPGKAMYRAAQSLVALERWDEASDCIDRGRALLSEAKNQLTWDTLRKQVDSGQGLVAGRTERLRRERLLKRAERTAIEVC